MESACVAEACSIPGAPFTDLRVVPASAPDSAPGVIAAHRDGVQLATIIARRGQSAALAQRIRERYGIELPQGSYRIEIQGIALAGVSPATWLGECANKDVEFAASLREELGPLVSVSDQSDAYAMLRLSGPHVRDTLAKLIPIDVHPRAFKIGDVAATTAAHMAVTLWRLDDAANGTPRFDIAVFRSFAACFWRALAASIASSSTQGGLETMSMRFPERIAP
jgi:methylglutamate dehydrogenase subunit D